MLGWTFEYCLYALKTMHSRLLVFNVIEKHSDSLRCKLKNSFLIWKRPRNGKRADRAEQVVSPHCHSCIYIYNVYVYIYIYILLQNNCNRQIPSSAKQARLRSQPSWAKESESKKDKKMRTTSSFTACGIYTSV